eukprot:COSAG01_NODE_275_length_19669_cov_8.676188_13_plen_200_part_00
MGQVGALSSSSSSSSSQQLLLPGEGGEDDCAPRARARTGAGGGGGGESFLRVHWVAVPEPLRARRVNRWRRRPGVLLPVVRGQPSGAPRCTLRQELRGLRRRARLPLQSTGAVTGTDRRCCCTPHARRGTAAAWCGRAGTTASEVFPGAQRITAGRRRRGVRERRRRPRAAAASALPLCTSALVLPAARAVRPTVGPLN